MDPDRFGCTTGLLWDLWNLVTNSGVTHLIGEVTENSDGLFVRVQGSGYPR